MSQEITRPSIVSQQARRVLGATPPAANLAPEPINGSLKLHSATASDWDYHEAVAVLHEWAERLNGRFNLAVQTPAISVDRLRWSRLGHYRRGRNGFGLRHEIAFNSRGFWSRSMAELLSTLLHEMLHEWQHLHGLPSRSRNNYHNKQFRQRAKAFGLQVDTRGHTCVVEGPFTALLREHGVDPAKMLAAPRKTEELRPAAKRALLSYGCSCTSVKAGPEFEAICLKCRQMFRARK